MRFVPVVALLAVVLATSCTTGTACPEIACDPSCNTVLNADGCIARCECAPAAPCDPITPVDVTGGALTLTAVRGPGTELGTGTGVGTAALVPQSTLGLSNSPTHHALLQSVSNGVRLLALDGVDPALGTLPAALADHVYDLGEAAAFGTKAPAVVTLPGTVGGFHAVAVASPQDSMTATGQSQVFALPLLMEPQATPPVAGTPVAANQLGGFPSGSAALVESRYLYVRNDSTNAVDALDLTTLANGSFATVASRTFATSAQAGLASHFAGALTPATNPANGTLALAYTDLGAPGAGIFVYHPSTLAFSHHRLPPVDATHAQDITSLSWDGTGAHLYATVDHYIPSGTFDRVTSRLYVFDVEDGTTPLLRDARTTTTETDPTYDIRLPVNRPVRVLPTGTDTQMLVLTIPNDGPGVLQLVERGRATCTATRHAQGSVGRLVYDSPTLETLDVGTSTLVWLGTQAGVQVWRGNW